MFLCASTVKPQKLGMGNQIKSAFLERVGVIMCTCASVKKPTHTYLQSKKLNLFLFGILVFWLFTQSTIIIKNQFPPSVICSVIFLQPDRPNYTLSKSPNPVDWTENSVGEVKGDLSAVLYIS